MRPKINKAIACKLLMDNNSYVKRIVLRSVFPSLFKRDLNGKPNNFDDDIDDIIIALEWWLGQLVYIKHGRKHDAKLLLKDIMESALIAYDRQPEVFKAYEKNDKINNISNNIDYIKNNGKEHKS